MRSSYFLTSSISQCLYLYFIVDQLMVDSLNETAPYFNVEILKTLFSVKCLSCFMAPKISLFNWFHRQKKINLQAKLKEYKVRYTSVSRIVRERIILKIGTGFGSPWAVPKSFVRYSWRSRYLLRSKFVSIWSSVASSQNQNAACGEIFILAAY